MAAGNYVVDSGAVSINTNEMMVACAGLSHVVHQMQVVQSRISAVQSVMSGILTVEGATACTVVEELTIRLAVFITQLQQHWESLWQAAVVYAAAEEHMMMSSSWSWMANPQYASIPHPVRTAFSVATAAVKVLTFVPRKIGRIFTQPHAYHTMMSYRGNMADFFFRNLIIGGAMVTPMAARLIATSVPFARGDGKRFDGIKAQFLTAAMSKDLVRTFPMLRMGKFSLAAHPHGAKTVGEVAAVSSALTIAFGSLSQRITPTAGVSVTPEKGLYGTRGYRVSTPENGSDLLRRAGNLEGHDAKGQIEILRHVTPAEDGHERTSWSVILRGTQQWAPGSTNPQDLLSNFQAMAGVESDQQKAVVQAMNLAGIKPGEPVEMVGHSQAGIVIGQMTSDQNVLEKFTIVSALTTGSPTAGAYPAEHIHFLALENTRDVVPALDGASSQWGVNGATVYFDGNAVSDEVNPFSHNIELYENALRRLEDTESNQAAPQEFSQWSSYRKSSLQLSTATTTTSYRFATERVTYSQTRHR